MSEPLGSGSGTLEAGEECGGSFLKAIHPEHQAGLSSANSWAEGSQLHSYTGACPKRGPLDDGSEFPGVLSHFGEGDLEVRGRQAGAQDKAPGLGQRTVMGRKGLQGRQSGHRFNDLLSAREEAGRT